VASCLSSCVLVKLLCVKLLLVQLLRVKLLLVQLLAGCMRLPGCSAESWLCWLVLPAPPISSPVPRRVRDTIATAAAERAFPADGGRLAA